MTYPEKYINSPFGTLRLWHTGDHIGLDNSTSNKRFPFVVNGVNYTCRIDLTCVNGVWDLSRNSQGSPDVYNAIIMRRENWTNYNQSHASPAALKKVVAWLTEKMPELIDLDFEHDAKIISYQQELARYESEIKDLKSKLASLEDSASIKRNQLAALGALVLIETRTNKYGESAWMKPNDIDYDCIDNPYADN